MRQRDNNAWTCIRASLHSSAMFYVTAFTVAMFAAGNYLFSYSLLLIVRSGIRQEPFLVTKKRPHAYELRPLMMLSHLKFC